MLLLLYFTVSYKYTRPFNIGKDDGCKVCQLTPCSVLPLDYPLGPRGHPIITLSGYTLLTVTLQEKITCICCLAVSVLLTLPCDSHPETPRARKQSIKKSLFISLP